MSEELSHPLVGKYVQLIYSDFKDGQPHTITKFGILVSVSSGLANLKFSDGKIESFGNIIKISESEKHD